MRGDGSLYLRGRIWWAEYGGQAESMRTADREEAERRLQRLRKAKERGSYLSSGERRIKVGELLDDLLVHVKNKGTAGKVSSHVKPVREELGHIRAADLDTATVERVQGAWKDAGLAPATINRRCERLRQAFRLAAHRTPPKVKVVPHIPMLKVDNVRQGYVSRADFEPLLERLHEPGVRDFVEWFWWTGMRPREIRNLTWDMLDRETWTIHLDPKAAKTRRGRSLAVIGPLREIMDRRLAARRPDSPLIFHRVSKGKAGQPVKDFRRQWAAARKEAKVAPGLLPYDLRRTALRNMLRAGTHETVAMKISGHRTRSTFDRYNITSTEDIQAAVERTAAYVATLPTERKVAVIETGKNTPTLSLQSGRKRR